MIVLQDQTVILAQVSTHPPKLSYDMLGDLHLTKTERYGTEIHSLLQLFQLLTDSQEVYLKFEFAPGGVVVVLVRSTQVNMTAEVCKEHRIGEPVLLINSGLDVYHRSDGKVRLKKRN
mmetsp:Transcript_49023/g.49377  ORF Transcript_49023/g.49377 Transcript_49023/m.49377 type:complete len:118 (-) Transcript_49023:170-523(-)